MTCADGVGMSNTTRHISRRRPPVSAQRAKVLVAPQSVQGGDKVDTLRRLVAAGQYQVSPKYLAMKIFKAAGLDE
jgi:anti-sigma28 factor (negative regulator of flagellin synthesis)